MNKEETLKKRFFADLHKLLPKLAKAKAMNMVDKEVPLLEQVHGILLYTYIWTRKGNSWYNPSCSGFSKHVAQVLREFEKVL